MKYNLTFKPIIVGNTLIKNRIVSSALSINLANNDGSISENIIDFFNLISNNNIGLVVVGGASISECGKVTKNEIHINGEKSIKGLEKLSQTIKKNGSKSCLQICHVGAQGNPKLSGKRIVGPSKYVSPDIGIECDVLKIEEIYEIEKQFEEAIIIANKAGFDFFEIHMAHGYLLHEFISEHTNKRKDKYGGNETNRLRIIRNIFDRISKFIDTRKIGVRISGDDYVKNGLNIKKLKNLIKLIDSYNIAYYSVTAGLYETAKQKYINMKNGNYWDYSQEIKKMTSNIVIVQGGIPDVRTGNNLLEQKKGDMFGMAQALIADPEIVTKTLKNDEKKIYQCLAHIKIGSCHRCRYLKQKKNDFACVTPVSWQPIGKNYTRKKDLAFWKKTVDKLNNN
jgi:2,4-dienoyl-CoA reductase-like NADH-dependent reductase (Old Yellow Enzyme family)